MFGFFKKKRPTVMDGVIRALYGDRPPPKSADLEHAIAIAHDELLGRHIRVSDIERVACTLMAGPIPYSTHDLAVATALSFFKKPELQSRLNETQVAARMCVVDWTKARKIAPGAAKVFEDALYRLYKPSMEAVDRGLDAKFAVFKKQNAGKALHDAAKAVREFLIWQRNVSEWEKPDDPTDAQMEHARRIERAFLLGAAGTAADGFSVPETDEALFMMNVVGIAKGLGPGDAEAELARMFDAADIEQKATRVGGAVMIEYLANGKTDRHAVHLAALQKECWN
jgi:hypothetical protein